jgi:excisionase family DNA binding protein
MIYAERVLDGDGILSLPQAARLLGVSPTTLKRWSADGRLPHVRTPGGHRRFLRSTVTSFAASIERWNGLPSTPPARAWYEGHPERWIERANGLCDPARMEAALTATHGRHGDWGRAGDAVVRDFLVPAARGSLADSAILRGLRHSFLRATACVAGRIRTPAAAPVSVVVWSGTPWSDAVAALAATVLREQGMCVLHAGALDDLSGFTRFVERQGPHRIIGVAGPAPERESGALLPSRLSEVLGESGLHLDWVAPGITTAPAGLTAFPRLTALASSAATWVRAPDMA